MDLLNGENPPKKKRINVKKKGNTYELDVVNFFKSLGYTKVMSSRASSKMLDDCKIDLNFIPYNVQCKAGYNANRPKWDVEKSKSDILIKQKYPKNEAEQILKKPFLLFHKLEGNTQLVTMNRQFFEVLMKSYLTLNPIIE